MGGRGRPRIGLLAQPNINKKISLSNGQTRNRGKSAAKESISRRKYGNQLDLSPGISSHGSEKNWVAGEMSPAA
jgi:hypothetical protein